MWLDDQWKYRFRDYAYRLELEARERKTRQTIRLVAPDFEEFRKHVISAVVSYRQGQER